MLVCKVAAAFWRWKIKVIFTIWPHSHGFFAGLESYASQSQEVPSSPQTNFPRTEGSCSRNPSESSHQGFLRPRHHPVLFRLGNHEPSKNRKCQVQNHLLRFHNKLLFVMIIPRSYVFREKTTNKTISTILFHYRSFSLSRSSRPRGYIVAFFTRVVIDFTGVLSSNSWFHKSPSYYHSFLKRYHWFHSFQQSFHSFLSSYVGKGRTGDSPANHHSGERLDSWSCRLQMQQRSHLQLYSTNGYLLVWFGGIPPQKNPFHPGPHFSKIPSESKAPGLFKKHQPVSTMNL